MSVDVCGWCGTATVEMKYRLSISFAPIRAYKRTIIARAFVFLCPNQFNLHNGRGPVMRLKENNKLLSWKILNLFSGKQNHFKSWKQVPIFMNCCLCQLFTPFLSLSRPLFLCRSHFSADNLPFVYKIQNDLFTSPLITRPELNFLKKRKIETR